MALKRLTTFERHAYRFRRALELKFWSAVNLMHVDSNSYLRKNRSSTTSFQTQLSFDRVVYFLSGSLTNSYSSFSSAVARLFVLNLICAQFTVPVDAFIQFY